jgi:hypothetical protein
MWVCIGVEGYVDPSVARKAFVISAYGVYEQLSVKVATIRRVEKKEPVSGKKHASEHIGAIERAFESLSLSKGEIGSIGYFKLLGSARLANKSNTFFGTYDVLVLDN